MFRSKFKLGIIGLVLFFLTPGIGQSQNCLATMDFDGDGFIGLGDITMFSNQLSLLTISPTEAYKLDVNGDCVIDQDDLDFLMFCATVNLPGVCQVGNFSVCCDPEIRWPLPCCVGNTGNVDNDPDDIVDISDLTALIAHQFITFSALACRAEANIDGDPSGNNDIADLAALIDHLFINFPPTAPCQ